MGGAGMAWHMIDEIDLVGIISGHAGLSRLCDGLEAMADALPRRPPEEQLARLRSELEHCVPTHVAREAPVLARLFPMASLSPCQRALLDHVRQGQTLCLVQAQDLVALLREDGAAPMDETLGYMLRCFFQACRHAMAFEEFAIMHLAGNRLTMAAHEALILSLQGRSAA